MLQWRNMAYEFETKVLEINKDAVIKTLTDLGAEKIDENRLTVDWYCPKGANPDTHPWFLRIRRYSNGYAECTWKSKPIETGIMRTHKEINFELPEPDKLAELFTELDLIAYAHQEKDRASFTYKDWRFDIDTYPGIPTYLEIEGKDEAHIKEAMALLKLENYTAVSSNERKLIGEHYKVHWHEMRF